MGGGEDFKSHGLIGTVGGQEDWESIFYLLINGIPFFGSPHFYNVIHCGKLNDAPFLQYITGFMSEKVARMLYIIT